MPKGFNPAEAPMRAYYERFLDEPPPNPRQQDKIIAIVTRGDPSIINSDYVQLEPYERSEFLRGLRSRDIKEGNIAQVFKSINARWNGHEFVELMDEMESFKDFNQVRAIISMSISNTYRRGGFDQAAFDIRDSIDSFDLKTMVRLYPDAYTFDRSMRSFMSRIGIANGTEKFKEYERSMRVLMSTVYGKQYEYLEQYKYLRVDAKASDLYEDWRNSFMGSGTKGKRDGASGEKQGDPQRHERRGFSGSGPEKPPSQEKPEIILVASEGKLDKRKIEGDTSESRRERYEAQISEKARIVPVKDYMRNNGKVPFVIEHEAEYRFYSIPSKHLNEHEALLAVVELGGKIVEADSNIDERALRRRLLMLVSPDRRDAGDVPISENEKAVLNTLLRIVLETEEDDPSFFHAIAAQARSRERK